MREIIINDIDNLKLLDGISEIMEDTKIMINLKLKNSEQIEFPVTVIHKLPNLTSQVDVKIVVYKDAKVTIPAEIVVTESARGTQTGFKAKIYLMHESAKASCTPSLFIHQKDILGASHGVTIKNIKDKDLVYLRSRGIQTPLAKELIVSA